MPVTAAPGVESRGGRAGRTGRIGVEQGSAEPAAGGSGQRLLVGVLVACPGDDAVGADEDGTVAEVVAGRSGHVPYAVLPAGDRVVELLAGAEVEQDALSGLQAVAEPGAVFEPEVGDVAADEWSV